MNPYYNLPPEQRWIQKLVAQFNDDELLWERLKPRRRARRKARLALTRRQQKTLDLREFAQARPPQDCIGDFVGEFARLKST